MTWENGSRGVSYTFALDTGVSLVFGAEAIRRERTGVHARITIAQDGFTLGYDTFNVERERERTHLANSTFAKLGKAEVQECPKRVFAALLDDFCREMYGHWMRQYEPEELAGDVTIGPPEYALEPWVTIGGGTIIFAPPGQGKSTLAFLMAQSINRGVSKIWHAGKPRKVLYLNLERDRRSIQRRLVHINNALGIESVGRLLMLNARGRALADVMDAIERKVAEDGVEIAFLDSITRAGYGDLTLNEPANQIMDALNAVCETWVAIAHTPRNDATHAFGSQMFDAAADMTIQLLSQHKEDGTLGIGLQCRKANDVAFPKMEVWAAEYDEHGLSAFRRARRGEFSEIEAGKKTSLADELEQFLLDVGPMTGSDLAGELSRPRSTVVETLRADRRFQIDRKEGRNVLYAVRSNREEQGA